MPEETEIGEVGVDKVGEHAAEHAREHAEHNPWMRWLGLSTALFAVVAAVASLKSGHHANEAILHGNEATLHQTEASDIWGYFQAKGIKAATSEAEAELLVAIKASPEEIAKAREHAEHERKGQEELEKKARELEEERAKMERASVEDLTSHQSFAYVVTTLQVAIGLSAVAALIQRKVIWLLALGVGLIGCAYFVLNLAHGI
jgi:hypothetical protein